MVVLSLTHTAHVHVRGRTWARVDVCGRMSLQLHAIVKYEYADTARYCVKLQQKSRNTTHKSNRGFIGLRACRPAISQYRGDTILSVSYRICNKLNIGHFSII